jgi:hypothetical protein
MLCRGCTSPLPSKAGTGLQAPTSRHRDLLLSERDSPLQQSGSVALEAAHHLDSAFSSVSQQFPRVQDTIRIEHRLCRAHDVHLDHAFDAGQKVAFGLPYAVLG